MLSAARAAPGTIVDYTYDAVGNIVAIQRSSTLLGISSFAPSAGPVGETVVLSGSAFDATPANNAVRFSGVPATVTMASRTRLSVVVPAGATTGPISVTVGLNSANSTGPFTITQGYGVPSLAGFTPACAIAGATISVSGADFNPAAAATSVAVGSASVSANVTASNALTFSVPAGAGSGRISVTTAAGSGSSFARLLIPPSGTTCSDVSAATLNLALGDS